MYIENMMCSELHIGAIAICALFAPLYIVQNSISFDEGNQLGMC